eukprot:gene26824-52921_t
MAYASPPRQHAHPGECLPIPPQGSEVAVTVPRVVQRTVMEPRT